MPGSAFGEPPEVLRLRLSTSSLYDSEASSPEEHELFLWQLLDQAKGWQISDQAAESKLYLPAVERAQEQLTAFVKSLGVS